MPKVKYISKKKKVSVMQKGLREIISVNLHQALPVQRKFTECFKNTIIVPTNMEGYKKSLGRWK